MRGSGASKPLVYDIGMNEGQNIPYYLSKGCRVVAVEAAPALVENVRTRFAAEIAKGDVTVLNLGISQDEGSQPFYLSAIDSVLSTFRQPAKCHSKWTVIEVPTAPLSSVLYEYGPPYFLKIDIEHYDRIAALDLLRSGITPPGLSVEVHSIDVLCMLIAMGYSEFQLVKGRDVGRSISRRRIRRMDGSIVDYEFQRHSAGPFGDDLDGDWLTAGAVIEKWLSWRQSKNRGWIDVHAQAPPCGLKSRP